MDQDIYQMIALIISKIGQRYLLNIVMEQDIKDLEKIQYNIKEKSYILEDKLIQKDIYNHYKNLLVY